MEVVAAAAVGVEEEVEDVSANHNNTNHYKCSTLLTKKSHLFIEIYI